MNSYPRMPATCPFGKAPVHWYCRPIAAIRVNLAHSLWKKQMLSIFILGFAGIALVQFLVAQWRAIWLSAANTPLSDTLRAATGIEAASITENDFGTLLHLCQEQAPGLKKISPWLPEVAHYYQFLATLKRASSKVLPSASTWLSGEMTACSRYVAVALDHHLCMAFDQQAATRSL